MIEPLLATTQQSIDLEPYFTLIHPYTESLRPMYLDIVIIFLAVSFLYYGFSCLFSRHMTEEFGRYGLPQFRRLIGTLEVAGALGLVFGYVMPVIQILAACGLALLMLLGCLLRLKIKDSVAQILPAFIFLVISLFVLLRLVDNY